MSAQIKPNPKLGQVDVNVGVEIEEGSDGDDPKSSSDSEPEVESLDDDPYIKSLGDRVNWKIMAVSTTFIHKDILDKTNLKKNLTIKNKQPVLYTNNGEPTILSVCNLDYFDINLIQRVHHTYDADLQFLRGKDASELVVNDPEDFHKLSERVKADLTKLNAGLVTTTEYLINFINAGCENLYDAKVRRDIEYFLHQRAYYLSMGRVKIKYDDGEGRPHKLAFMEAQEQTPSIPSV